VKKQRKKRKNKDMVSGKPIYQMRKEALEIFQSALKTINPERLIFDNLSLKGSTLYVKNHPCDLDKINNLYILGIGKAAAKMAQALEKILDNRITDGLVITKYGYGETLHKIEVIEAGHPLPDESGLSGSKKIIEIAQKAGENDLILFLISGGGSALFTQPVNGISLQDIIQLTSLFLSSGATIYEINTLRKHISQVKGGRFAQFAYPAQVIGLILSDVIGDDPSFIASGPITADNTTYNKCWDILVKYNIRQKIPPSIKKHIEKGLQGKINETPKKAEPIFEQVKAVVIGNNRLALIQAKKEAELLGYNTFILSSYMRGEAKEVACFHSAVAKEILTSHNPIKPPACIISGGETTVTLKGNGKGGRSQELALAAAIEISTWENIVAFCAGTDGTDGPTDAAGAVADSFTVQRAEEKGINAYKYAANNDSYNFFKQLNDLIITGPTYTNVMDIYIFMVDRKST
jgi:glycerate 2-kinase